MSASLAALAREKELLLARSTLCRLRLRSHASALRDAIPWRRGLAVPVPALARAARFAATVVRAIFLAKTALSLIRHALALGGIRHRVR
jgi:hypothetical protein